VPAQAAAGTPPAKPERGSNQNRGNNAPRNQPQTSATTPPR